MLVGILDLKGNKICVGRVRRDGLAVKNKVIRQVNGRLENKNVSFGCRKPSPAFQKASY